jgi:hypothetical protein
MKRTAKTSRKLRGRFENRIATDSVLFKSRLNWSQFGVNAFRIKWRRKMDAALPCGVLCRPDRKPIHKKEWRLFRPPLLSPKRPGRLMRARRHEQGQQKTEPRQQNQKCEAHGGVGKTLRRAGVKTQSSKAHANNLLASGRKFQHFPEGENTIRTIVLTRLEELTTMRSAYLAPHRLLCSRGRSNQSKKSEG